MKRNDSGFTLGSHYKEEELDGIVECIRKEDIVAMLEC
jgi:hypothetical protein